MSEINDDGLPWTEARWEAFMTRSDMRSAKFGELLETFMDHPDRDAIIDREMGWNIHEAADEAPDFEWEDSTESLAEYETERAQEKAELEAMPAYILANAFGMKLHDVIKPLAEEMYAELGDSNPDGSNEIHLHIAAVLTNCFVPAARLVGGHAMGCDDDVIGGNVVKCRQSLAAAQASLAALEELQVAGKLPPDSSTLISENRQLCQLIAEHIATLKARMWWD